MKDIELWLGDCLELMKDIPDKDVDMILADLPYGTTACKWDIIIPFDLLWNQYKRIIKNNGAIVLTSSQPFTSLLISSNLEMYKYSWIWEKDNASNFFAAKFQPLNNTEDINVFSFGGVNTGAKNPVVYFPQGIKNIEIEHINGKNVGGLLGKEHKIAMKEGKKYTQKQTGYPFKTLRYTRDSKKTHPTQKPVGLMEYLIKTYTKEGELVLDNTMGVGTTMKACKSTKRRGIGIEMDKKYFDLAVIGVEEFIPPQVGV